MRQGEVAPIRQRRLNESIGDAKVLVAVEERRARHLDLELLEDVRTGRVEVEAHVVEPVEVVGGLDAVLGEEAEHVALVNELGNKMLALPTLSRGEVTKDGVGENVETAKDDGERPLEGLAASEGAFDEARPADLNGDDDELSRVGFDPPEETLAVERGRVLVERLEVLIRPGEELGEGDLHLVLELGEPVVDLGELGEDDGSGESNLLALPRRHTFDAGDVVVEE